MPRYSPHYYSPPRRGYGGRGRSPPRGYSPPRRGYSPPRRGNGRHKEANHGSLLVRNIPMDCRPEELRVPFERFGLVRDVYIPKDYYTGEPRGFAFVQFVDPYESAEAQYQMNGQIFAGRELSVVAAAESRKRPEEMRRRTRVSNTRGRNPRYGGRRSPHSYRSPRTLSVSRSRSPRHGGSKGGYRSRSISPSPRRQADHSISPRRPAGRSRSPRESPRGRDVRSSYTPNHDDAFNRKDAAGGYDRGYDDVDRRAKLSPAGRRSRFVDLSPERSR